jgi:uncharacterized protein (UPF0335 family)
MTTTPPKPDDPAWEQIRARYEAGTEKVTEIAASIGLSRIALSLRAKAEGWKMRGATRPATRTAHISAPQPANAKAKAEPTRATLLRLKEMLQARVAHLEQEIKDIGREVDEIANDRQIKAVHLVVRTLEKVMELERKDKLRRGQARRDHAYFDAEQRRQLAEKIDRLEPERNATGQAAGASRSGGAEQPVALLGETRPAATAGE